MKNIRRKLQCVLGGWLVLGMQAVLFAQAEVPYSALKIPDDATANVHTSQLAAAVRGLLTPSAGKLTANEERTRGPAAEVYSRVAPATVVVRTRTGHGTGFVIDPAGWIITNHHVIERADIDPATGAFRTTIHFGRWNADENRMEVIDKGVPGLVYKASQEVDLALIKVLEMPADVKELPVLKLADKSSGPGAECVSIGHPKAGMLWTVRSGEVSGVGRWPREMIDVVMTRLSATNEDRQRLETQIAAIPPRKVLMSSCGVNPGDSGGPLVNSKGELIAVTFAIPKGGTDQGISLDKFSYHIHLDEVKTFLMNRPDQPPVHVPDPWPMALLSSRQDNNGNTIVDTLLFATERGGPTTGLLIDVDEDTGRKFTPEQLKNPPANKAWDFEFAFQQSPHLRAFYDTDGDGKLDLIVTDADQDQKIEAAIALKDGVWQPIEPPKLKLIDPAFFTSEEMRSQFTKILQGLFGAQSSKK